MQYHNMTADDVAQVLWSIFLDARQFFSNAIEDPMPTSNLMFAREWLLSGTIKESYKCPVDKLVGRAPTPSARTGSIISGLTGDVVSLL